MKTILAVMFCVFSMTMVSCSNEKENRVTWLGRFDYKIHPTARKVVYRYLDGEQDSINHILIFHTDGEKTLYSIRGELNGVTTFDYQFLVEGNSKKILRDYIRIDGMYTPMALVPGDVKYFRETAKTTTYPPVEYRVVYPYPDGYELITESSNEFVDSTQVMWNDTLRTTLRFRYTQDSWVRSPYLLFLKRNAEKYQGYFYFMDGVGFYGMETTFDDGSVRKMRLLDIQTFYK